MRPTLYTENVPGNLHQAAAACNDRGRAPFVLAMDTEGIDV